MDMVRLGSDGGGGMLLFQHLCVVLCVDVDRQQDWTREGGENPQQPPGAHPQTEEGPSKRSDLLHCLRLPAHPELEGLTQRRNF